jgi:ankyrin repeat protein
MAETDEPRNMAWYSHSDPMRLLEELMYSRGRFDSGRPVREIDLAPVPSGTSVDSKNEYGQTALHCAALRGDMDEVCALLKMRASVTKVDKNNMTPLHYCATHTHQRFDIVEKLLDAGASLNERDSFGRSAFSLFCINPSPEVAKFLLKRRPSLNSKDKDNWTPLHFACAGGSDLPTLETLLQSCDALSADKVGRTPLHLACSHGHLTIAQYLIQKADAKVNTKDSKGWAPLATAVANNHPDLVTWLIEHGNADIHTTNERGWTCLHLAAAVGGKESAQLLIDAKIDLDAVDHDGRTALHNAIVMQSNDVVKLLIASGASTDIKDSRGWTASQLLPKTWWQTISSCQIM